LPVSLKQAINFEKIIKREAKSLSELEVFATYAPK